MSNQFMSKEIGVFYKHIKISLILIIIFKMKIKITITSTCIACLLV